MLHSMTGYGKKSRDFNQKRISVELKSLNSKFLDLKIRIPQGYREKEMEMRKLATKAIERGKLEVNVDIKYLSADDEVVLNKELFSAYYKEMIELSKTLNMESPGDLTQAILRMPNVVMAGEEVIHEEEWNTLKEVLKEAIGEIKAYRLQEGETIENDFRDRVGSIQRLLQQVEPYEQPRVLKLRERFTQNLEEWRSHVDENRLEQEIIYYMEKLDLTEEKVRLAQHCLYFIEQLDDKKATTKGRKLNFIAQEMGREINTLGAKANSSDIQKIVVQMKDELEKIKEQIANVL